MKNITKVLAHVLSFFAGCYFILFIIFQQFDAASPRILNTAAIPELYNHYEPRYIVWNQRVFATREPKIVILGSSNVRLGFLPAYLQLRFPDFNVHNISTSGAEVIEVKEIIRMVLDNTPPEARGKTVFVFGMFMGNFIRNPYGYNNGLSNFAVEMTRYPLFRVDDHGDLRPLLPRPFLGYWTEAIRPYLLIEMAIRKLPKFDNFRKWFFELLDRTVTLIGPNPAQAQAWQETPDPRQEPAGQEPESDVATKPPPGQKLTGLDALVLTDEYKRIQLQYWRGYMGTLEDGSFPEERLPILLEIAEMVTSAGARLLIVDLPQAKWKTDGLSQFPDYEVKKKPYFQKLRSMEGIYYLNLQRLNAEFDFFDSDHPKSFTAKRWSRLVADELEKIVSTR